MNFEIVKKESEGLFAVLPVKNIEELNKFFGCYWAIVAEKLLNSILFADCGNNCLGFESIGLLRDAYVIMWREPGMSGKGTKAKDRFIKVVNFEASFYGFI
jgi:hypothetical protein